MNERLPLSALRSQALVAFTIEFDNEFERQTPHRTTTQGGSKSDPWLVSMVFWQMLIRFIPTEGISAKELMCLSGLTKEQMRLWVTRLSRWWGYITVEKASLTIRPTEGGKKAIEVWTSLTGVIEKRWRERFGKKRMDRLVKAMQSMTDKFDQDLPDNLPVLEYRLLTETAGMGNTTSTGSLTLPAMLSKLLFAFSTEFESLSGLSMAMSANVLRIVGSEGVRVRDLPRLSGVSKEAIAWVLGRREEDGLAQTQTESTGSRTKVVVLTAKGRNAREKYGRLAGEIEDRWRAKFGEELVADLRDGLEGLQAKLFEGLEPYVDGWRAAMRKPETLPHYPMILHRGGFPDGS